MSFAAIWGRESAEKSIAPRLAAGPVRANHLGFLDALRGWAILGVVAVHVGQGIKAMPDLLTRVSAAGSFGVQLFFIVSAFTLMLSLKRRPNEPRAAFFTRRLCRILPLYILGVIVYGGSAWVAHDKFAPSLVQIVAAITFTNGFHPIWINSVPPGGWSVTNEMWFYLCVPLIFTRLNTLRRAAIAVTIAAVVGVSLSMFLSSGAFSRIMEPFLGFAMNSRPALSQGWYFYFWFPAQLAVFLSGVLAYHIYIAKIEGKLAPPRAPRALLVAAFLIAAVVLTVPQLASIRYLVAAASFVCVLLSCSMYSWPLITHPAMQFLGKISFSIYLAHFMILHFITPFVYGLGFTHGSLGFAALFTATLLSAAAVSTVTYHAIEVPGIRLGSWIINRYISPRQVGVTAAPNLARAA